MYKKKEIEFKSTNLTDKLKGVAYIPVDTEIKGILQICHGMCEYIERYEKFAEFLCEHGYIVCGHDHAGHGKSASSEEKLGYFAHENGWQVLVDDLYKFTRIIKDMFPEYPIFLMGHSMGSFVARLYASYYTSAVSGLIISGTGSKNPAAGAGILLCNAVKSSKGEMYRSKKINDIAFGGFNKKYENPKNDFEWLTRDEKIVEKYMNDKFCMFTFTVSAFKDLFTLNKKANETTAFKNTKNDLPIFILSGDMDPVGNYGKGVKAVYSNYLKNGKKDVSIKLYKDGRHEMVNELNKEEVFSDVLNWLDSKVK